MRILIVDDEGIVLSSCRKVLAPEGFEVLTAGSADDALAIIQRESPALLLLDIKMPIHDGIYLMKALGSIQKRIPVIVISGYSTEDAMKEAYAMGASRFLPKPFTPDELLEAVRQVVGRS